MSGAYGRVTRGGGPAAAWLVAEQVEERSLTRQRIEMLGHLYVVELVASQYVEFPDTAVYRAKQGGAFVAFRFDTSGRSPAAAQEALDRAMQGDPVITLFVRSAGKTTSVEHRIGVVGDPRGANPQVEILLPGPFSVPDVGDAEYWIEVDGERLDVIP